MKKTLGIFLLLAAIFLVTGIIEPRFLKFGNMINMARWTGLYGILAIGACFVIITGGIDLSIGSLVGLTGSLFPLLLVREDVPIVIGFILVFMCALTIGLIHGFLITKLRLQPFIVTLCGLFIYRGIARYITGEINQGFGNEFGGLRLLVKYRLFDKIPMPFIILIGFGVVAAVFLNKTIYGRYLLALGRNRDAARFSGINTDAMIIGAYVICSVLAGFGGILFALDQNSVQPSTFGNFYELYAIAGAVLGGCSLRGGEGAISGVIFGTAMVEVIKNSVFFLNVPTESEFTVIGFVILIGVTFDELIKRMAVGRRTRVAVDDT
ncbi:TPA: ABC transporter permease [Candidatus Poribacteria bacterium]|nr:ABC transporter permease [Candidatus Poribacteria bacterium]HIA70933.1 ABC transporter permease [Candidatus Poribacteria bacterium]HIB89204.1 ABC transporter permease [Candidatus Poribacteria bacterium]HIC00105.1 ABC transporter permease [Candidatus Poribacteria bacterium]HIM09808.1 ABC transporter permease [Candidatus Poribacteria bacterium]